MAMCKFCGKPFQWGKTEEGWVPLEPIESHEGMDRQFQDENGILRADHRSGSCINRGGPAIRAVRLARAIPASDIIERTFTKPDEDGVITPVEPQISQ
jgi:hypothetical protein